MYAGSISSTSKSNIEVFTIVLSVPGSTVVESSPLPGGVGPLVFSHDTIANAAMHMATICSRNVFLIWNSFLWLNILNILTNIIKIINIK